MAKMKIYEIAKSLNRKSSDLVHALNENGFEVKSHNSNIEDEAIAFVLKHFSPKKEETVKQKHQDTIHELKKEETKKVTEEIKKEDKKIIEEVKKEEKKPVEEVKEVKVAEKKVEELKTEVKAAEVKSEPAKVIEQVNENKEVKTIEKENNQVNNNQNYSDRNNNRNYNQNNNDRNNDRSNNRNYSQNNSDRNNNRNYSQNNGDRNNNRSYSQNNGDRNNNRNYSQNNSDRNNNRNYSQNNGDRNNNRSYSQNNGDGNSNRSYSQNNGDGNNNRNYSQNNGDRNNNRNYSQNNSDGNNNRNYSQNNGDRNNNRTYSQNNGDRNNNRNYSQNNGDRNNNRTYSQNNGDRNNNRNYSQNNGDRNNNRTYSQNSNDRNNNRPYNQNNNDRNNNRTYNQNSNDRNNNRFNNNNRTNSDHRPQGNDRNTNGRTQNGNRFERPASFETPSFDKAPQRKNDYNNKNSRNDKNRNNKKYRNDADLQSKKQKDPNRKGAFIMPKPIVKEVEAEDTIKTITIPEVMTIRDLADKMKQPAASVVKKLFLQGKMVSINQEISFEEAEEIALEFNCIVELEEQVDVIEEILKEEEDDAITLVKRPPVVCVMGHVDHGKTSLLDAIRETSVTEREAGGITQHIGAYTVTINGEKITFLDTPGHEAFTSMRMRGAKSTDIAILVVAADDGVMPQTVEAISHAKAAEVEIIVAINKIDKPGANIERVKQELSEYELIAEDWGGSTVFVPVSAKTKDGLEQLLEMISITAEVSELKANPNRRARGIVIEAQLDKGRGPVATILVQKGTLYVGDSIVIGSAHGKVRAMVDDKGRRVKEATPSTPVEILGLNEVPDAGEIFMATENDKEARSIAEAYIKQGREKLLADTKSKLSLDGLFSQIQAGNVKELNLIIKADVQGSVEAVKQSLVKLSNEEVAIRIIHGGVGAINESDVTLASASNAIIIGFNVRPDPTAKDIAEREKVDLRLYKVIYSAIEDVEAAMKGMLDPIFEEKVIGHAEVRQIFKASGIGIIAGSYVLDGKIVRGSKARITRDDEVVFDGELASLKRFKDDVKEVASGYECGLVFEKFNDIKEEDKVELYVMEEVPR